MDECVHSIKLIEQYFAHKGFEIEDDYVNDINIPQHIAMFSGSVFKIIYRSMEVSILPEIIEYERY